MGGFNVALLGLPGAGKGTQAAKLSEKYDVPAIGMGDLLRAERDAVIHYDDDDMEERDLYFIVDGEEQQAATITDARTYDDAGKVKRAETPDTREQLPTHQETIGQRLDAGGGPSTATSAYFLEPRLNAPDCDDGYVLDGFPRKMEQAAAMDAIDDLDAVIYLDVSEEHIYERLGARGREDDTPEEIATRISWQRPGVHEVFYHYGQTDTPIETVNADQAIDAVWNEVRDVVEQYADE